MVIGGDNVAAGVGVTGVGETSERPLEEKQPETASSARITARITIDLATFTDIGRTSMLWG
jgi:hypothetical protein